MAMVGPLAGANGDPGAPTINARKHRRRAPLLGADGDLGAPTINIKKRRRWAAW
jgi:hypothetical protein